MTKLTVSAGESKVLQLPENSVTLSAFVLPVAAEGKTEREGVRGGVMKEGGEGREREGETD